MTPITEPDGDAAVRTAGVEAVNEADDRLFRELVQEHSGKLQRFIIVKRN